RQAAETENDHLFNLPMDLFCIVGTDGYFKRVNKAFTEVLGYSSETLLSQPVIDFIHVEDHERTTAELIQLLQGIPSIHFENRYLRLDGQYRWLEWAAFPVGELIYAVARDVTTRKLMEKELRQSESRYRALADENGVGIWQVSRDYKTLYVNQAMCDMLGVVDEQQLLLKSYEPYFTSESLRKIVENRSLRQQGIGSTYEVVLIHTSGRHINAILYGAPILNEEGELQSLMGTFVDITSHKQAMTNLAQEKCFTDSLIDSLPGIFYFFDQQGRFLRWNKSFEEVIGYSAAEIKQLHPLELFQGDDIALIRERIEEVFVDGRSFAEADVLVKSGALIPFYLTGQRVLVDGLPCLVGMGLDLTQHKQALRSWRASEERYQKLVKNALVGIYRSTPAGYFEDVNPALVRMLGYSSAEEVLNLNIASDVYVNPTKRERIQVENEPKGFLAGIQAVWKRQDGEHIIVRIDGRTILNEQGQIIAYEGMVQDITERKEAEEALRNSRAQLAGIIGSAMDAIITIDGQQRIVLFNEAAEKMFRCSAADVLNTPLSQFIPARFHDQHTQNVQVFSHSSDTKRVMGKLRSPYGLRSDGEEFPLEASISSIEVQGQVLHTVVLRDVTEYKRIEKDRERLLAQTQEQARQVRQIIDAVPEGVLLLDNDGRVNLANPLGERYLKQLMADPTAERITQLGDRTLAQLFAAPPHGLWHDIAAPDGRDFQAIARPLEPATAMKGWVMVLYDATREREIQQLVQEKERLAAVGQLASGIAHDFNNILAVITLYTQMILRSEALSVKTYKRLETIEQQTHRAKDLIQQILDFSRQAVIERVSINLGMFIEDLIHLLSRTLPETIQIDFTHEHDDYIIKADPSRMQQIIMNLAFNARDAMEQGGRLSIHLQHLCITAETSPPIAHMKAGNWIRVRVTDSGSGMSAETLARVFEPFFTTKESGKGTGLGLAQVYGIVQQHEGHITVDSTLGEGTTFDLYFPASVIEIDDMLASRDDSLPRGNRQRILIVEDNHAAREALVEALTLLNYQLLETDNGVEALKLLETNSADFDLVLSDVVMPEMGGIALLEAIHEKEIDVPVVLMTGHPLRQDVNDLRKLGLQGWFLKPPDLVELAHFLADLFS
ncbi:MAG: PAS domain S-box protein, partial [Anaerolineales bacterium]|nr:PAS domain S-box protein [Anaerolineales bacterium]